MLHNYFFLKDKSPQNALAYLLPSLDEEWKELLPNWILIVKKYVEKKVKIDFIDWLLASDEWKYELTDKKNLVLEIAHSIKSQKVQINELDTTQNEDWYEWYAQFKTRTLDLDRNLFLPKIQKFAFSPSALNSLLADEKDFFWQYILPLPTPYHPALFYGSAFHYALEQLYRKMQQSRKGSFPSEEAFIQFFIQYLSANKEMIADTTYEQLMKRGTQNLSKYYQEKIHKDTNKIVSLEKYIHQVKVDDIPIKGFIDKLTFDGKKCTIVDYKTGRLPIDNLPENYERQLRFYFLLVSQFAAKMNNGWQPIKAILEYVEPDENGNFYAFEIDLATTNLHQLIEELKWAHQYLKSDEFGKQYFLTKV